MWVKKRFKKSKTYGLLFWSCSWGWPVITMTVTAKYLAFDLKDMLSCLWPSNLWLRMNCRWRLSQLSVQLSYQNVYPIKMYIQSKCIFRQPKLTFGCSLQNKVGLFRASFSTPNKLSYSAIYPILAYIYMLYICTNI